MEKTIQAITCKKCTYVWYPRKEDAQPKQCPRCKSMKYEIARKFKKLDKEIKEMEKKEKKSVSSVIKPTIKKKSLFD